MQNMNIVRVQGGRDHFLRGNLALVGTVAVRAALYRRYRRAVDASTRKIPNSHMRQRDQRAPRFHHARFYIPQSSHSPADN